jgi:amidohydrolase
MDALPILETNDGREYLSQNSGVMHACGHDSHTSMALAAAKIIAAEKFKGTVRFLFQPSEEIGDADGISGAPRMIEDNALDGVDMVIAQHVDPQAKVGTIGINAGAIAGGAQSWYGKIFGVGSHGAHPNKGIDPFVLLAHVITALNSIISRKMSPFAPAVISIGIVRGGFTQNVIPEEIEISGTLRYTNNADQEQIQNEMRRAFEITKTLGGNYDLQFEMSCPPVINTADAAQLISDAATGILGAENVTPITPTLGAEDFGAFTEKVSGAMFTLGTRIEGDERFLHHPRFDIDERAMPIGAAVLAETALKFLRDME